MDPDEELRAWTSTQQHKGTTPSQPGTLSDDDPGTPVGTVLCANHGKNIRKALSCLAGATSELSSLWASPPASLSTDVVAPIPELLDQMAMIAAGRRRCGVPMHDVRQALGSVSCADCAAALQSSLHAAVLGHDSTAREELMSFALNDAVRLLLDERGDYVCEPRPEAKVMDTTSVATRQAVADIVEQCQRARAQLPSQVSTGAHVMDTLQEASVRACKAHCVLSRVVVDVVRYHVFSTSMLCSLSHCGVPGCGAFAGFTSFTGSAG